MKKIAFSTMSVDPRSGARGVNLSFLFVYVMLLFKFVSKLKSINTKLIQIVKNTSEAMPFYAVASGRSPGIYETWSECENQVKGFSGAKYKKFNTQEEANAFAFGGNSQQSNISTNFSNFTTANQTSNITSGSSISLKKSSNFRFQNNQDGVRSRMAEIEKDFEIIENRMNGRLSKSGNSGRNIKKPILITALPSTSNTSRALKRPADPSMKHFSDCKKTKTINFTNKNKTYEFSADEQGFVEVFTDGACSQNGRSGARAGLGVYWGRDHPLNVASPVSGRATNNCGEIQAASKAIRQAHEAGVEKLCIKTDSQFVINAVTKWMGGWKRKGWKLASGEPVKNEIDFKELDAASKLMNVKWVYVNAHKGVEGNEEADKLAKHGATLYDR